MSWSALNGRSPFVRRSIKIELSVRSPKGPVSHVSLTIWPDSRERASDDVGSQRGCPLAVESAPHRSNGRARALDPAGWREQRWEQACGFSRSMRNTPRSLKLPKAGLARRELNGARSDSQATATAVSAVRVSGGLGDDALNLHEHASWSRSAGGRRISTGQHLGRRFEWRVCQRAHEPDARAVPILEGPVCRHHQVSVCSGNIDEPGRTRSPSVALTTATPAAAKDPVEITVAIGRPMLNDYDRCRRIRREPDRTVRIACIPPATRQSWRPGMARRGARPIRRKG